VEVHLHILRAEGEDGIAPPGESSKELLNCWVGEQRVAARQEPGKGVGEVKGAPHPKRVQTC
jgi:hypothetical protein